MGFKNKLKSKGQHRKERRSSTRKEGDQASPLVMEAKNSAKLKEKEGDRGCQNTQQVSTARLDQINSSWKRKKMKSKEPYYTNKIGWVSMYTYEPPINRNYAC